VAAASDVLLNLLVNDGTTPHLVGIVNLTAGAGTGSAPPADVLSLTTTPLLLAFVLPAGYSLQANVPSALTGADAVILFAQGGHF
jgi:hypothetical protein